MRCTFLLLCPLPDKKTVEDEDKTPEATLREGLKNEFHTSRSCSPSPEKCPGKVTAVSVNSSLPFIATSSPSKSSQGSEGVAAEVSTSCGSNERHHPDSSDAMSSVAPIPMARSRVPTPPASVSYRASSPAAHDDSTVSPAYPSGVAQSLPKLCIKLGPAPKSTSTGASAVAKPDLIPLKRKHSDSIDDDSPQSRGGKKDQKHKKEKKAKKDKREKKVPKVEAAPEHVTAPKKKPKPDKPVVQQCESLTKKKSNKKEKEKEKVKEKEKSNSNQSIVPKKEPKREVKKDLKAEDKKKKKKSKKMKKEDKTHVSVCRLHAQK